MLDLEPWRIRRLTRRGLLHPERDARRHYRFAFVDLVILRTVRALLGQGVPFGRVRAALEYLRDQLPADRSLTELKLDTDGRRVIVREEDTAWDAESLQGLFDFQTLDLAEALAPLLRPRPRDLQEPGGTDLDAAAWYELGCELEFRCAAEAQAAYRRAIEADPGHVDARVNLGRLCHESGDLDAAERHYRSALELRPNDLTARFNLGVALEDAGRLSEARNAYREAILADPDHADAHFNLAGVYERLGQQHHALRHLKAYRQLLNDLVLDDGAP
jgi:tetratricopeptide (TPR) repeat protein